MTDKAWTDAGVEYQTVQAVAVLLQACIQRCRMAVGLVMFNHGGSVCRLTALGNGSAEGQRLPVALVYPLHQNPDLQSI